MPSNIRAGSAYIEISTRNKGLDAGFLSARRHLGSFVNSVRAAELKMRNFSVSARNLGLDMIKLGVVLGTPVAFGVKQFADFEKAMARVSTFLQKPQDLIPKFQKRILELSDKFGVSATDMANGLAEILSANIPASKSFEFLEQAMKGSIGNAVDFKDQLSGLITFMQAYEGSGLTAARATELLRVAVEEGRIPANDLANTMGMVASKMAQAGGSAEELIATYSALSTTGLSVSEQTTMFRGILTAFSDASPETAKEFERLSKAITGVAQPMTLANLRTQGFTKTLEWLTKLSSDDLGKIFKDVRASNGIVVLSSKMELFKKSLEAARGRSNLADKAFETMSKTLSHLGEKIVTVGKNLAIQFGEVLLETLKKVGNALIEIGNIISSFIKANPELAILLTKMAVSALLVGGALVSLALVFSILSTALSGLVAIGGVVVGVFTSLMSVIGGLVVFLFSWSGAIVAFGVILASTFVDFGKIFDSIKDGIKSGLDGLKSIFGRFKDSVVRTFDAVKNAVAAKDYDLAVKLVVNKIKLLWFQAVEEITKKYDELKDKFIKKFTEVKVFIADLISGIMNELSRITKWDLFSNMSELFGDAFQDMDGTLKGFAKTWIRIWSTLQEVALSVVKVVNDGLNKAQRAHYQDIIDTWGTSEGTRADSQQAIVAKFGGGRDAQVYVNELAKTSANIEKNQELLLSATKAKDIINLERQIREDEKVIADSRAAFMDKLYPKTVGMNSEGIVLSQTDQEFLSLFGLLKTEYTETKKMFDSAFAVNSKDVREAISKMTALEKEDAQSTPNFEAQIAKIEAEKNDALGKKDDRDYNAERLQRLNASFGNTPFADRQKSILQREEQRLIKEAADKAKGKEFYDRVIKLNDQFGNFWQKTFGGDAIVPNNTPDQTPLLKIEQEKIRDGIMGAFNTNALGNFSNGDVMKSMKALLEEALKKSEEAKKQREEDLEVQKQIQKNTSKLPTFTGG